VAANLAAAAGRELPGELTANPLLQRCFEALADPRPEVQDCAAASLGQVFFEPRLCWNFQDAPHICMALTG
jgi:hypothetical protein